MDFDRRRRQRDLALDPEDEGLGASRAFHDARCAEALEGLSLDDWFAQLNAAALPEHLQRVVDEAGVAALPSLMVVAQLGAAPARLNALRLIAASDPESSLCHAAMRRALDDRSCRVRRFAMRFVDRLLELDVSYGAALARRLGDSDVALRRDAALLIARIAAPGASLAPALRVALRDRAATVRAAAALALEAVRDRGAKTRGALLESLRDPHPEVRRLALNGLRGLLGEGGASAGGAVGGAVAGAEGIDEEVEVAFAQAVGDPDPGVARAARATAPLGSARSWAALRRALASPHASFRRNALNALFARRERAEEVLGELSELHELLSDPDVEVQHRAFYLLRGDGELSRRVLGLYVEALVGEASLIGARVLDDLAMALAVPSLALRTQALVSALQGVLERRQAQSPRAVAAEVLGRLELLSPVARAAAA